MNADSKPGPEPVANDRFLPRPRKVKPTVMQRDSQRPGPSATSHVAPPDTVTAEHRMTEIASLLRSLDESAANSGRSATPRSAHENHLVQVRLGIASSLFMSLRCKHAATAAHSLRVALGCSAWAMAMGLPDSLRDTLEVAALLHDVGKIGIPDHILQKPGNLTADEAAIMEQHPRLGVEILTCCCAPQELLNVIKYAGAWYDGSKHGYDVMQDQIPVGGRIVAIVDAFDSMTTDHVYRRAMSRERALAELFEYAGRQFDPELVRMFSELHERSDLDLHAKVSQRWLEALAPDLANQQWRLNVPTAQPGQAMPQPLFQQKLLDNMYDGVVFVDSQRQIFMWNQGAERLSGIAGSAANQRTWTPSLLKLRDEKGRLIADADCPVAAAIISGVQSLRRLSIAGRGGKGAPIDLHAIPVVSRDGTTYGATLLLHDASNETSLEQRCLSLHSQATRDPLTQVANRAEFDRVHNLFIDAHTESKLPCALIICDIDHFKQVNDNYGHQAGDEAIKSFAALLKSMSRHGDLVARYGGEEFVLLCADCNNATATARADQIRRALADLPQPMLGNKRITASFGVTENQPGDTPEIMLRRADRALLEAKGSGRNRVVQLGSGNNEIGPPKKRNWWWPFGSVVPSSLVEADLSSNVPLEVAVQKLRGFVADQNAEITSTGEDIVQLTVDGPGNALMRRTSDRSVPFIIELRFSKVPIKQKVKQLALTRIKVTIRPKRDRDRRRDQATQRARHLLSSLKSYLMAREEFPEPLDEAKARQG